MGWGDCGEDNKGRPIGYCHEATCDHPGCEAKIDRGLSYACGGMHGEGERSCEGYFCGEHLVYVEDPYKATTVGQLCEPCKNTHHDYLVEELLEERQSLTEENQRLREALKAIGLEVAMQTGELSRTVPVADRECFNHIHRIVRITLASTEGGGCE